jgi:hypothetical protein
MVEVTAGGLSSAEVTPCLMEFGPNAVAEGARPIRERRSGAILQSPVPCRLELPGATPEHIDQHQLNSAAL